MSREDVKTGGISVFDLKCIAVVTMIIDHVGAYFFPGQLWLRCVGRLAFPIYCFLIAEGYIHTRDVKKYMGRLFVLALLSEIPFDLLWYGVPYYRWHQNVFFTLLLGLVCICVIDRVQVRWQTGFLLFMTALLMHFVVKSDYGIGGIAMIVAFYLFRARAWARLLSVGAVNILLYGGVQCAGVLALVPIQFYRGKKGPSAKHFFYVVYPVHLLMLFLIGRYLFYVS